MSTALQKMVLAAVVAVSTFAGFPSGAFAVPTDQGKTCEAVFEKNKAMIESMAGAGNVAGIRDLLAKAGCPQAQVNVEQRPLPSGKSANESRLRCKYKFPATIICTFGLAVPVRPGSN
jgi:hypothetical protein